jgi:hypothetical protein
MSFANWPWRRPRLGLAFTERFLLALRLGSTGRAREEESRSLQRELPDGMVTPGPVTPNIESVGELARMAAEMVDDLSGRRGTLSVALPDLSIVTAVVPAASPPGNAEDPGERLASRLAFPVSEARLDFWRGRKGEVLGAAVRGAVIRQYEQIVDAVDCRLSWVDGASLVRIPLWAEASASEREVVGRVQLYRSHYHLAIFRGGELLDIRTRLRSDGDVEAVAEELLRLPALAGVASFGSVVVSGEDAGSCVRRLSEEDGFPLGRVAATEEGEETQLAATLEALMRRV